MRNLPQPARDDVRAQLASALEVRERNGQQTGYPASAGELNSVVTLYDAYDAAGGAPGVPLTGADLDLALRLAIHDAYDLTQQGRRLAGIRAGLMHGIEHCPICGISPPRALDHFLPKSTYQPLAIYVRNLVPLCTDCNQSKAVGASMNPAEQFIHPYFEALPEGRFLRGVVTIDNGGLVAEFGVDPAAGLADLLTARLEHQFRRLRLNARYAQEINTYLVGHTTALGVSFSALGADGVRGFLNQQAEVEFGHFHPNHWRPVLLTALANHDAFCAGAFRDLLPQTAATGLPIVAAVE